MSHYYKQDGSPLYTLVGKNGKERDTNLGDARKLKLVPSVTTILSVLDKPQLNKWQREKVLECVHLVPDYNEYHGTKEEWEAEVWKLYKERTSIYSIRGSEVHSKLERFYKTGVVHPEDEEQLSETIRLVKTLGYHQAEAEANFADPEGYGGQIDLVLHPDGLDDKPGAIIDFKTRQGDKLDKRSIYDSYLMQIAAYRNALPFEADCYNILISVTHPDVAYLHKYTEEELQRGLEQFECLLQYWKLSNNYDGSFEVNDE